MGVCDIGGGGGGVPFRGPYFKEILLFGDLCWGVSYLRKKPQSWVSRRILHADSMTLPGPFMTLPALPALYMTLPAKSLTFTSRLSMMERVGFNAQLQIPRKP